MIEIHCYVIENATFKHQQYQLEDIQKDMHICRCKWKQHLWNVMVLCSQMMGESREIVNTYSKVPLDIKSQGSTRRAVSLYCSTSMDVFDMLCQRMTTIVKQALYQLLFTLSQLKTYLFLLIMSTLILSWPA